MYEENSLEYKIEKVYTSLFSIRKFKKIVYECNRNDIIKCLKFHIQNGSLGVGIGWSEDNHTIVDLDKRGIHFNHNEKAIYSFKEIAELLTNQYGKYYQLSLFKDLK